MTDLLDKKQPDSTGKTHEARRCSAQEIVLLIALLVPMLVSLGFRLLLVFHRAFDPDEYQYLHHAWMIMNGYLPYRDFFHNHTPGLWYLLAPLAWLFDESPAYLFACRIVMVFLTLAIFFMVYKLAATGPGYLKPLFSTFLLSLELWFVARTIEVRPDQVVILSWLFGVWFLLRSAEATSFRTYGLSGLSVGIGLLFSPKALFAIAAVMGALLLLRLMGGARAPAWRALALFALMSLTPLVCLLLVMWSRDGGWPFLLVRQVFLFNLAYPSKFSGLRYFNASLKVTPLFWGLTLIGCALAVRKVRRPSSERERKAMVLLASSALVAGLVYFVFIPVAYAQSLLPLITFLAIVGAECWTWIDGWVPWRNGGVRSRRHVAFLAGLLAAGSILSLGSIANTVHPLTKSNRDEIERMTSILRLTTRSEAILDGYALYVMRPQASFYGTLFLGLRDAMKSGSVIYDIPQRCAVNDCPVVILDKRLLEVAPWMIEFVRANYAPSTMQGVYLRRDVGGRNSEASGR